MEGEKKSKTARFWAKLAVWVMLALVAPIAFIGWRYDLFKKVGTLQLSGWGAIALVIAFAFALSVLKWIKRAFEGRWTYPLQIVTGLCKVTLPLALAFFLLCSARDSLDCLIQALGVTLACETAGIFFNPLPEWAYEQSKGRTEDAIDALATKLAERKKEE